MSCNIWLVCLGKISWLFHLFQCCMLWIAIMHVQKLEDHKSPKEKHYLVLSLYSICRLILTLQNIRSFDGALEKVNTLLRVMLNTFFAAPLQNLSWKWELSKSLISIISLVTP